MKKQNITQSSLKYEIDNSMTPLKGEIEIPGSKNAAMPLLLLAALVNNTVEIKCLPNIDDIRYLLEILTLVGYKITKNNDAFLLKKVFNPQSILIPAHLSSRLRGSIYLLALAAVNCFDLVLEGIGGDALSGRSFAPHLRALRGFGIDVEGVNNNFFLKKSIPKAAEFDINDTGVTATSLAILIAISIEGTSIIHNASTELENTDVIEYAKKFGATIEREGRTLLISGPIKSEPSSIVIPGDQIVWGTYVIASILTGGYLTTNSLILKRSIGFVHLLEEIGIQVAVTGHQVTISGSPKYPAKIKTGMFPLFPSDLLPQIMVLLSNIDGVSEVEEMLYYDRYAHVNDLKKMGMNIIVKGNKAQIFKSEKLIGCTVEGKGIRETCALILAGLIAQGKTIVYQADAINRGYENLAQVLNHLGANIIVTQDTGKS